VKKRRHHIAPVLFLVLLLLPMLCMVVLQAAQWYLKSTAGERLAHHKLITISSPVEKVIWHKKDKEISIDGRMFDIRQHQLNSGNLYVTGYFDDEEMSLTRLLLLFMPGKKQSTALHFFLVLQCFLAALVFISFALLHRSGQRIDSHFPIYLPLPVSFSEDRPPKR
jgi:hypothetical protein